jgi:hypothetical protein
MVESNLGTEVTAMLLESAGEEQTKGPIQLLVYYEEQSGGYTYGVHNSTEREIEATFDCSNNKNMLFSTRNPVSTVTVPSGAYRPFFTAMCDPSKEEFGISPKFRAH